MYLLPFDLFGDVFSAFGLIVGFVIAVALALVIVAFYVMAAVLAIELAWVIISAVWYWIRRLYYWVTGKTPPDDIGEILGHKQIEAIEHALDRAHEKAKDSYEKSKNSNRY